MVELNLTFGTPIAKVNNLTGEVLLVIILVFTLCLSGCEDRKEGLYDLQYDYDKKIEYFPGTHWSRLASPELAGWSTVKLDQARQYSERIHSSAVVIIENGVIVAEWGNIAERYNLHSIRKSLMSCMVGILIDHNQMSLATSLKDLQIQDVGGLTPKEEEATLHDLLTARSGVFHPAAYETEGMEEKRPLRGSHDPGTFWYYNNWDFNVLLTIFNQVTQKDFFEQFNEKIAQPLEMEQFRLKDTSYQYDMEYSSHPAYLFRMSALDLSRFGLLYLRKGKWREQQIISTDWIQRSTQKYSIFNQKHPERGYGYLWWIDERLFYAAGTGGQRLFVIPELNVVVVHRVDTDSKVRVKTKQVWNLLDKILESRSK